MTSNKQAYMKLGKLFLFGIIFAVTIGASQALEIENMTFAGGSNESFENVASGKMFNFSNNDVRCGSGGAACGAWKNMSFDHNYNISIKAEVQNLENAGGDFYIAGIANNVKQIVKYRVVGEVHDGRVRILVNDSVTQKASCAVATGTDGVVDMQWLLNGTFIVKWDGVEKCQAYAGFTPVAGDDAVYLQGKEFEPNSIYDNLYFASGEAAPVAQAVEINWTSPQQNESFNTDLLQFNFSVGAGTFPVNCSLRETGTTNQTHQFNANGSVALNVSYPAATEKVFNYSIECLNPEDSTGTENRTIIIDRVFPIIQTSFTNLTAVFYAQNLTGQFNFTDDLQVFSYNVSIDGVNLFSDANLTTTNFEFNLSYNTTGLTPGLHILTTRMADGHTANELGGDFDVSHCLLYDCLRYEFYDGGWVKVKGESIFDRFTTEKKLDRYTFDYEPSDKTKDKYDFTITSDQKINIIDMPDSKYKTWVIIGEHWGDFITPESPNAKVKIKKISDYEVEVEVKDLEVKDKHKFDSFGDLNIVEQNYTFLITNATLTYSNQVIELSEQTITLVVNTTGGLDTNATLYWNGSLRPSTKTEFPFYDQYVSTFTTPAITTLTKNVTFFWNTTINNSVTTLNPLISGNQSIIKIGIDNCSTHSVLAVNITTWNETPDVLINTSIDGYFELWTDSVNNFTSFNESWRGRSNYGICINPNGAEYNVYGQLEFIDSGEVHATKTYYFTNVTFDNVTDQLNLYVTAGTTQVEFNVRDETDEPVERAIIKILSYDHGTNTAKVTEILQTDTEGQAQGQIVLNTKWYQFIVETGGVVRQQTTEPTKITSTTNTFKINLATDYYASYDVLVDDISTSLTFNNVTNQFTYSFTDATGASRTGCLEIYRKSTQGDTLVNSSCVTSSAGIITLGLGATGTSTFLAVGTIQVNPNFVTETLSHSFNTSFKDFGTTGLFLSLLMVAVLMLVGIWDVRVSVILGVIGFSAMVISGILYVSLPVLISFIIIGVLTIYRLNRK